MTDQPQPPVHHLIEIADGAALAGDPLPPPSEVLKFLTSLRTLRLYEAELARSRAVDPAFTNDERDTYWRANGKALAEACTLEDAIVIFKALQ